MCFFPLCVNLPLQMKMFPVLSFCSLIMHAISCNSHFVVMDTDRRKKKVGKKKKKTSSVSIATESSLVLPKMV